MNAMVMPVKPRRSVAARKAIWYFALAGILIPPVFIGLFRILLYLDYWLGALRLKIALYGLWPFLIPLMGFTNTSNMVVAIGASIAWGLNAGLYALIGLLVVKIARL